MNYATKQDDISEWQAMRQPTTLPIIKFTIQSGSNAVRQALAKVIDGLAPLALTSEDEGTIKMVMAEVLNNVVEHGYPEQNGAGPIGVTCEHLRNGLNIAIVDIGVPMPGGQTPPGLAMDTDVAFIDLPEGGFGWLLIKQLATRVTYSRVSQINKLEFRIDFAGRPKFNNNFKKT
jgi:serine/threonine-protein kinase RsbW